MSLELNDVFIKHPKYLTQMKPENNVIAFLQSKDGDKVIFGTNRITTHGVSFYAHTMADENPDINFFSASRRMFLQNPTADDVPTPNATWGTFDNPITASVRVTDTPHLANADTDNSGRGPNVITWKSTWTAASFGQTADENEIRGGCITDTASPSTGSGLLAHWVFDAPFRKTTNDTLTVWVNHSLATT